MNTSEDPARDRWRQVNLTWNTRHAAQEAAAGTLAPLLLDAEQHGILAGFWYVRKADTWRLRLRPSTGTAEATTQAFIDLLTGTLTARGLIRASAEVVYEPEIHAFGGPDAMDAAHTLFEADSRHLLHHLHTAGDHLDEIGILLATRLLQAAGCDFYEQGDVWAQVAAHRRRDPTGPARTTITAVQILITAAGDTAVSPLATAPDWPTAYETAGSALAEIAARGHLTRGLRAVLAHHLLFAFNRLGVRAGHQYQLADAARRVIFHRDTTAVPAVHHPAPTDPVTRMSAVTADTTTADPAPLRAALIARLDELHAFRGDPGDSVRAAFEAIWRHRFLPGVDLEEAYVPRPVVTKRAADGTAVSSASSPYIVAGMLRQLCNGSALTGKRLLEIGAATGFNAALLAHLTGPTGSVTTIEYDDDLAAGARANLTAAGFDHVEVIYGDGAHGHPAGAPYDGIEVTAGSSDIFEAWWQQLAPGGTLVVPVVLHDSGLTRSVAFQRTGPDRMISTSAMVCGFVPMRGAGERPGDHIRLADDVVLKVASGDQLDRDALARALMHPAHEHWTGLHVRDDEPVEHLDLWLATHGGVNFGRLGVGSAARKLGIADPSLRWSGATIYDGATVAYLAARPAGDKGNELGLVVHGPESATLAKRAADLLHTWDEERPNTPTITAIRAHTSDVVELHPDRDTRITITW